MPGFMGCYILNGADVLKSSVGVWVGIGGFLINISADVACCVPYVGFIYIYIYR